MQATLDTTGLKPFTRALGCLSRYGDDLTIYATPDSLSLSSTNSSMSAYARYKFSKSFFVRYNVGDKKSKRNDFADGVQEVLTVTGQLLTKSLLSILKHRTVEKSVTRCELSVVEGVMSERDEVDSAESDTLESKLIVRLHCKHGVIKTHKLLLLTPTSLMAPGEPEALNESRLTIGPRSVKDMIEHFPATKSTKSDPQLIWSFNHTDVQLKSVDSFFDSKAGAQLSTELTISADEFDVYDIYCPPITIAFHLREFNATIAFAESLALTLDLRFTDPLSPLFIDVDDESFQALFVISTSQLHGTGGGASQAGSQSRKRTREEDEAPAARDNTKRAPDRKKPMKVVQRTDVDGYERAVNRASSTSQPGGGSMPPPSVPRQQSPLFSQRAESPSRRDASEPLFLPASQLSQAQEQAIRDSGLGIENMNAADQQIAFVKEEHAELDMEEDSLSLYDESEILPTQEKSHSDKVERVHLVITCGLTGFPEFQTVVRGLRRDGEFSA
ncbi:hypothetical protein GLOTRDRAFT_115739 [Gloeophyllum trabeum ATCC 11539]|uniref:Rad9-domain-containing protein n=1 Tax=Gloeophyllum trabeum (strain ATCC 11539 / FP-39264 / Madison 617) TaxID=670483 RepID=S7RPN2_GLOTA|nr:uncharacterized protein GLOTRDRAFT_115739 [Gloeophyllum trabeum ATCC 11539]EPQ56505.1 hypothetical protein GLOTRDRAFT_115739 [Gloeophyllum trabeum ATCC 11539]